MRHDALVIGAGVNGLATAAVLAKSGLRVLVVERRETAGGCYRTDEIGPGFRCDTVFHDVGWVPPALVRELGLSLPLVRPDPALVAPLPQGGSLALSSEPRLAAEAIRRLSPRDAERWPEFATLVGKLAGFLEELYSQAAPRPPGEKLADLARLADLGFRLRGLGRRDMVELLRVVPMSVAELLDDWFEADALKGALGALGVRGIRHGPRSGGTGFLFLHHMVGGGWRVVRGGMGRVAAVMEAAARGHGAEIRTAVEVQEIVVRGGRATGVLTADGGELSAGFVVSALDPRRTLLGLVHPAHLDPEFAHAARHVRLRGAVAKVNLALDALPDIDAPPGSAIVVAPNLDHLERAADDAKYGRTSSRPFSVIRIPSLLDPSLAPAGKHVMSVWVQYVPYGERTTDNGQRLADAVIATLEEYWPGFSSRILHQQVLTPHDLEREYGLTEGCLYHGEMGLDQILFMRPVPGWAHYRTPIRGLYLCGPGTHPGGGLFGASGWLAAQAVFNDAENWKAWATA